MNDEINKIIDYYKSKRNAPCGCDLAIAALIEDIKNNDKIRILPDDEKE